MSDLLFDVPAVESPRLKWIKRHGIKFIDNGSAGEDELGEWERWTAYNDNQRIGNLFAGDIGNGATQDDALADWARKHKVRLWNEENDNRTP